jgi:hypothetical protein
MLNAGETYVEKERKMNDKVCISGFLETRGK